MVMETAWPSGQVAGLAIQQSRVQVPDHYLDLFLGTVTMVTLSLILCHACK